MLINIIQVLTIITRKRILYEKSIMLPILNGSAYIFGLEYNGKYLSTKHFFLESFSGRSSQNAC